MGKIVRKTAAECKLTSKDRRDLAELSQRPDSEINYSDIPKLTEGFWKNAVPNPWYKPVKKQVTLRIDADILAWLRGSEEAGYQSRLNALLRHVMLQDLESKRKRA